MDSPKNPNIGELQKVVDDVASAFKTRPLTVNFRLIDAQKAQRLNGSPLSDSDIVSMVGGVVEKVELAMKKRLSGRFNAKNRDIQAASIAKVFRDMIMQEVGDLIAAKEGEKAPVLLAKGFAVVPKPARKSASFRAVLDGGLSS
jgi:hypothetical protein